MIAESIRLYSYYRAHPEESVGERHQEFMSNMQAFGSPLGFQGLDLPIAPDLGDEYIGGYRVKMPIKGLTFQGIYQNRRNRTLGEDHATNDDNVKFIFKRSNSALDYTQIVQEQFPKMIQAYRGYRAWAGIGYQASQYVGGYEEKNDTYNKLREDPSINVDGRNNIFTLHPAQYWDELLCQKALGYGPEEVIRRLDGLVPKVEPLMDGVYLVLNDDKDLSFDEFVAFNDRFKPILGLI
jgi:hypothetical protein